MEQCSFPLQEYADSGFSSALVYAIYTGKMPKNAMNLGMSLDRETGMIIIEYQEMKTSFIEENAQERAALEELHGNK